MTQEKYNKRQLQDAFKKALGICYIMDEALKEICRVSERYRNKEPFMFANSSALFAIVDEIINKLNKRIVAEIEAGEREAWALSASKNIFLVTMLMQKYNVPKSVIKDWDSEIRAYLKNFGLCKNCKNVSISIFKQYGIPVSVLSQEGIANAAGLSNQIARTINGRNLSKRVWNITDQFRQELELALDIGLGEGKSAADLSRDVRRYLNEPERLFRRVRDKHGVLRLSKAAKAYHPGQGVHRSSYKNALRLAATEINIAYRTADYERWQTLDYVIGTIVNVSPTNHIVPDICDELSGEYPKQFKWVGWHPSCKCFAVPKLADLAEFIKLEDMKLEGKDVSAYKFSGEVTKLPGNFDKWYRKNEEKVKRAKSLPYFIEDNKKIIGGF